MATNHDRRTLGFISFNLPARDRPSNLHSYNHIADIDRGKLMLIKIEPCICCGKEALDITPRGASEPWKVGVVVFVIYQQPSAISSQRQPLPHPLDNLIFVETVGDLPIIVSELSDEELHVRQETLKKN